MLFDDVLPVPRRHAVGDGGRTESQSARQGPSVVKSIAMAP